MKATSFPIAILVMIIACAHAYPQQDALRIDSAQIADTRIRIAVPTFATLDPAAFDLAREMSEVIAFDLRFSGLFILLMPNEYPPAFVGFDPDVSRLDFDQWRATRAEYLIYGVIRQEGSEMVAQFRLFDLATRDQIVGQELRVERIHARLAAHRFSEEVIRYLDGVPGIGTSQIYFSGGQGNTKEIYVADYDGANVQQITRHGSISIKPQISPDASKIAYLSYKDRYAYLYLFDRRTGLSVPLSKEVGLNAAPGWSPDGQRLAMVLSKDANMEIYLRDVDGKNATRLTRNRFADTSPTFSPDGSRIAFVSDRGGSAQIYVMNANGGDETRLSFQGGGSYDPVWSPDGKSIAYVVQRRGHGFQIWVMNADGSNARQITDARGINDSPAWSPDSRHVAFMSNRSGRGEIYAITLATGEEHRLSRTNLHCEGPSWGPRRP